MSKPTGQSGLKLIGSHDCWSVRWVVSLTYLSEPRKNKTLTFHYTGCLIGILMMVDYNPHIAVYPKNTKISS